MKGDVNVLKHLNKALKGELMAINQYFLHARLLEHWGVSKLAAHEYKESMEEMGHADILIKRIIALDGIPNMQDIGKLHIGENVKEVLQGDLTLETEGIQGYRAGIKACEEAGDPVTCDILTEILADEEGHYNYLQTQLDMIETMGLQNYILLQSGGDAPD